MRKLFFLSFSILFTIYSCSKDESILEEEAARLNTTINKEQLDSNRTEVTDNGQLVSKDGTKKETSLSLGKTNKSSKSTLRINSSFDFGSPVDGFGDPNDGFGNPTDDPTDPDTDVDGNTPPPPPFLGCPEWIAPIASLDNQGEVIHIYYDPNLVSLDEINCIRKDFFERYCYLRMSRLQNEQDPYHDVWVYEYTLDCDWVGPSAGTSTKSAAQKAEEDPRTCVRSRCR